jgi:hypothetical protein
MSMGIAKNTKEERFSRYEYQFTAKPRSDGTSILNLGNIAILMHEAPFYG